MKSEKRFLVLFAAVIAACCVMAAACSAAALSAVRRHENEAVLQLAASVKDNLSETELLQILNGSADTEKTKATLRSYGITDSDWIVRQSGADSAAVLGASAAACAFCGAACFAVFMLHRRRTRQTAKRLTQYLAQINSGNYDLDLNRNSEDENSVLQNEIYRTTVMLREAALQSREGRESLKTALSDISHQLKTPLTSIQIMTENLLDNPGMPEELRREFLGDIRRATAHISALVQSLLTLSKLDADSIVLKKQPEKLSEVLHDAAKNTAVLAELRGVRVMTEDNGVTLDCDRRWLGEALGNIVKNCVEHTPEGGTVRLAAEGNPLYTKIVVSDNGKGINPDDLPHIFERFYKGKNAGDDSVGIGLALAKAIVEKAGGCISADSTPGKGSMFTIKFFKR